MEVEKGLLELGEEQVKVEVEEEGLMVVVVLEEEEDEKGGEKEEEEGVEVEDEGKRR